MSLDELSIPSRYRKNLIIKAFDEIYNDCWTKIKIAANEHQNKLLYQLPEFKMGYPIYDIKESAKYVTHKLLKLNETSTQTQITVKYFEPVVLYITWNDTTYPKNINELIK